mgnify:CR=1 FL=1
MHNIDWHLVRLALQAVIEGCSLMFCLVELVALMK